MKRSAMKSNVSVETRCPSESSGRLFPRRKSASKSIILNGTTGNFTFDKELSLAIQESLKYAALQEQDNLRNTSPMKDSEKIKNQTVTVMKTAEGHINHNINSSRSASSSISRLKLNKENRLTEESSSVMAGTRADWANDEICRLKDLLLTQTELIECQQEELQRKDKEICDLNTAKDALQCRLERMERRMAMLKHRDEIAEDSATSKPEDQDMKTSTVSHPASVNKSQGTTANWDIKRKRKRRKSLKLSHKKKNKHKRADGVSSDKAETGDEDSVESNSEEEEEEEVQSESEHDSDKENIKNVELTICEDDEKSINYTIMQTDSCYHLYYPKHVFSSLDTDTSQERINAQLEVETPSWRLKTYTNMYQLEGTENITDEAYYKRHLKMEQDEKKRKRWDMQRLRELKAIEKSQRQKEDELRASPDEMDVETFLPSVQELRFIEVTESLPVMAFGQPLPYVSPAEFEIPWEVSTSLSSSSRLKNSSHSKK